MKESVSLAKYDMVLGTRMLTFVYILRWDLDLQQRAT